MATAIRSAMMLGGYIAMAINDTRRKTKSDWSVLWLQLPDCQQLRWGWYCRLTILNSPLVYRGATSEQIILAPNPDQSKYVPDF